MLLSSFPEAPSKTVIRSTSAADTIDDKRTRRTAPLSTSDTADSLRRTPSTRSATVRDGSPQRDTDMQIFTSRPD